MSLKKLLKESIDDSLSGVKWHALKQSIVKTLLSAGDATIAELSGALQSSIPTVTKAINELLADEVVVDLGKVANSGGRRPSLYSITASSAYFLGVEVMRTSLSIGLQNIKNEFVSIDLDSAFVLENTHESLDRLCHIVNSFVEDSQIPKERIVGACVNLSGRINSMEGFSYNYFFNEDRPLVDIISEKINLPVYLENDTRAMTLGEYAQGDTDGEKNVIFLNYSWGIGIGLIIDGKLYYGKSGYSGEFGHSPIFSNNKLCHCGKEGCLETELSGWALVEQFEQAKSNGRQSLIELSPSGTTGHYHKDIILGALIQEDSLCIDLITDQCEKMGRYLSVLLNIFNPGLLIVGGDFAQLGDFALLPIQASLKKHSVSLVNKDMKLKKSSLGGRAGVIGACYVVKEKMLAPLV